MTTDPPDARKRRPLPNRPVEPPTVWQHDQTPDGFCEVTVEVNHKILATRVIGPDTTQEDMRMIQTALADEVRRRC